MTTNKKNFDHLPEKAIDALNLWDNNTIGLWSIEMGGIGPSYEQCIQFSTFELIRAFKGIAPKSNDEISINKRLNEELLQIDKKFNIGHSCATAGAAKWLAYKFMKNGYRKTLQEAPDNRLIQVDKKYGDFKEKNDK